MDLEQLSQMLLVKAIEHLDRNDLEKCDHATRILLRLHRVGNSDQIQQPKPTVVQNPKADAIQKQLDEKEALENLELANDAFKGQLWMTIGDICEAFAQPKHEVRKWVENGEVVWQPREGDSRGTRMINAISVAARIDRGHCPPN